MKELRWQQNGKLANLVADTIASNMAPLLFIRDLLLCPTLYLSWLDISPWRALQEVFTSLGMVFSHYGQNIHHQGAKDKTEYILK